MKRKASDESPDPSKDSRRRRPGTPPPNNQPGSSPLGPPRDRVLHPLPANRRPLPHAYPNRPLFPERALPHFQRENRIQASPNAAASGGNNQPEPSPSGAPRDPALNSFPNEVRHVLPDVRTQPLPGQVQGPPHHSSAGNSAQTNTKEAMIRDGAGAIIGQAAGVKRRRESSGYDDSDDEEVPKKEEIDDEAAGSTLKGGKRIKHENGGGEGHEKGVFPADGSHGFANRDSPPFAAPTGGFDRHGALFGGYAEGPSLSGLHSYQANPRRSVTTFTWDGTSYNFHIAQESVQQGVRDEREGMLRGIQRAWPGVDLRDILPHTQRPYQLPPDPLDWCNPMLDWLLKLADFTRNDMAHAHELLRRVPAEHGGPIGGILGSGHIEAACEMRKKEMRDFQEAEAASAAATNATVCANGESAFASASTTTATDTATPQAPAPTVTDEDEEMEDADEEIPRPDLADRAQQIVPQRQQQPHQHQPPQPQMAQPPRRGSGFSVFDPFINPQSFVQQMPGFLQPHPAPSPAFMNGQHFDQQTPGFQQADAASGFGHPGPHAAPEQRRQQARPEANGNRQLSAERNRRQREYTGPPASRSQESTTSTRSSQQQRGNNDDDAGVRLAFNGEMEPSNSDYVDGKIVRKRKVKVKGQGMFDIGKDWF